ncbi:9252_t:CDS:1 [Acaulospora morrowiae]|uniref:9252_t:CDS:1 n=1 Tax=Acaulospora morrowiae TaxID=94023 RepID=A0A9N9EZE7_9GLOM|nr:9252_t:CDS:1 [Acaulospora morrowiae]
MFWPLAQTENTLKMKVCHIIFLTFTLVMDAFPHPCDTDAFFPMIPPICFGPIPKLINDVSCCSSVKYESECCNGHVFGCCDETEQQVSYCDQNENSMTLIEERGTPRVITQRSPSYYDAIDEECNQVQQSNYCDKNIEECCMQNYQTNISNDREQEFASIIRRRRFLGNAHHSTKETN